MSYIDTHTHALSTDFGRYPLDPVGGKQSGWSQQRPVTIEGLLAAMDDAGIEQAVLVHASTAYGYDNSYAADSLIGNEARLAGVCAVDLRAETVSKDLAYWLDDRGFTGVRLKAIDVDSLFKIYDDAQAEPAWGELQDRQTPVCISLNPAGVAHARNLLERFPRLRLVVDHAGSPDIAGGPPYSNAADLFRLSEFDGVFLKLTSVTFERIEAVGADVHDVIREIIGHFGVERLMWGTNFPATAGSMAELVARAERAFEDLSQSQRETIFAGTAAAVYPTLARSRT